MAGKKINELTQAANIADSDLFIVETANGTQSVPYSSIKSEDVSFNGTGANSIALGVNAKANDTNSIAIGKLSKANANSIALGCGSNCSGTNSIALGCGSNCSGTNSIALIGKVGVNKMYSIALGINAVANSNSSIAIGKLSVCDSEESIAIGSFSNSSGVNSVALGYNTKANNGSIVLGYNSEANGIKSIILGINANTDQWYSIALGYNAKATGNNSTVIGYNASTSNANSIQLGDAANLSSITAKVPITTTSDERDKTDITEIEDSALEFFNKVKAIRYVFNGRKLYIDNENLSDEEREKLNTYGMCDYDKEAHAQGTKKGSRMRVGVSAQNIQQALIDVFGDSGYANLVNDNLFDYNPDDIPDGVESQLAVNYEGFIPFLIKAVQELDARVKELENK